MAHIFSSGLSTETVHAFLIFSTHGTFHILQVLIGLIILCRITFLCAFPEPNYQPYWVTCHLRRKPRLLVYFWRQMGAPAFPPLSCIVIGSLYLEVPPGPDDKQKICFTFLSHEWSALPSLCLLEQSVRLAL